MKTKWYSILTAFVVLGASPAFSEEQKRPDFSEMRQKMEERMLNGIKQRMKSSDEEWDLIGPMIKSVLELKAKGKGGMIRGGMKGGKPGGGRGERPDGAEGRSKDGKKRPEGGRPDFEAMKKQMKENQPEQMKALRASLEDEASSAEDIKSKLDSFRAMRDEKKSQLQSAQAELKSVLTVKQEAVLVLSGIID